MKIKEFFKPTTWKIILFIILVIISYYSINIVVSAQIPQDRPYCIRYQAETLHPNFITYLLAPFSILLFGTVCNHILLIIINLPYLYIISCLLIFIFNKLKTK